MDICRIMFDIQMFAGDITPGPFLEAVIGLLFRLPRMLLDCPLAYMST